LLQSFFLNIDIKSFPVDRWLDENEGDGKIALDLQPDVQPTNKKVSSSIESKPQLVNLNNVKIY
jgi:hypothetical protein